MHQIEKLNLRIGDYVYMKGGEIIPKIMGFDPERRGNLNDAIQYIDRCQIVIRLWGESPEKHSIIAPTMLIARRKSSGKFNTLWEEKPWILKNWWGNGEFVIPAGVD